ncbi:MAG TPA: SdrD B-like domain-containing protein, partial [Acidimicrobiales bacterium]|nr:SdrD B-like domain-containing protein [Acidimicrobiales bacterium]
MTRDSIVGGALVRRARRSVSVSVVVAIAASLLVLAPPDVAIAANNASIAGTVFNDANGNGTKETTEAGLAGVAVALLNGSTTVGSTTSSSTGAYSFTKLGPATYSVRVTVPSAFFASSPNPLTVVLANGQAATGKNFGLAPSNASIGDLVFNDANGNGTHDAGELGQAGVAVTLANGGTTVGTTLTSATGTYAFTGLAPATYTVTIAVPSGFASTTANPRTLTLGLSQTNTTVDFGVRQNNASIGDLVWLDSDGDGTFDAGESGIAGARVALVEAGADAQLGTADDVTRPEQTTPASGAYAFTSLPAGTYRVSVDAASLPAGTTVAGAAANPTTLVLGPGQARADVDFAVRHTGSIGDRVWLDADADGAQDAGESGLSGVTVRLFTPGPDATLGTLDDVESATATTDASGAYLFPRLAAGTYRVQVSPSSAPAGTAATTPVNRDVVLAAGTAVADADFGFRWTGSVGDRVWFDTDADGEQDAGENGLSGVTLSLSSPGPDGTCGTADDVVVATTASGAAGTYSFDNVAPGAYRVRADGGAAPAGAAPPADVDVDVAPHGSVTTADFGFRWAASIGDLVWLDSDGDRAADSGEPGVSGVIVSLSEAGIDGALGTADDVDHGTRTTDAAGAYRFAHVAPGSYRAAVAASARPARTVPSTPSVQDVVVAVGTAAVEADFGFSPYETTTVELNPAATTTVAGNSASANTDGTGTGASFYSSMGGVAIDGNRAFVATSGHIRQVDLSTGATTTLAGSTSTGCTDGTSGAASRFGSSPSQLATDGVYVYSTCSEYPNTYVRRTSIATGATTMLGYGGTGVVLARDGYLYTSKNLVVYRMNRETGATTTLTTVPSSLASSLGDLAVDDQTLWVVGSGSSNGDRVIRVSLADGTASTALAPTAGVTNINGIASAGSFL